MPTQEPPVHPLAAPPRAMSDLPDAGSAGFAGEGTGRTAEANLDPPPARGWSPPIDGHGLFKSLMLRLPRGVRRSFDHEQLLALRQAAEEIAWGEHPLDMRFNLPWPGGRCYLVLVGGRERRARPRRPARRFHDPLVRVGNHASLATLIGLGIGLALLVGLAAAPLVLG
jgi:hypothetical protein